MKDTFEPTKRLKYISPLFFLSLLKPLLLLLELQYAHYFFCLPQICFILYYQFAAAFVPSLPNAAIVSPVLIVD